MAFGKLFHILSLLLLSLIKSAAFSPISPAFTQNAALSIPASSTSPSFRPRHQFRLFTDLGEGISYGFQIATVESWREYVPLVVSCFIILDILLGSPAANLILAPMKRATDDANGTGGNENEKSDDKSSLIRDPNERIDSGAIAQSVLEKANDFMERTKNLEENKTAEQRYEEIRRKIDAQVEELDSE